MGGAQRWVSSVPVVTVGGATVPGSNPVAVTALAPVTIGVDVDAVVAVVVTVELEFTIISFSSYKCSVFL